MAVCVLSIEVIVPRRRSRTLRFDSTHASSVDPTEAGCFAPRLSTLLTVQSGVSWTANGLCETVIRPSTRLRLIEVFLYQASQVGKQAFALPPV